MIVLSPLRSMIIAASCVALAGCDAMPDWFSGDKAEVAKLEGERVAVLGEYNAVTADPTLADTPIELAATETIDSWPQHAGSESGYATTLAPLDDLTKQQTAEIGDGAQFEHGLVVSPVIASGNVFAMDAQGFISSHQAANIDVVNWVSPGVANADEDDMLGGGLAFSSGALYGVSGRGLVVSLDGASGRELWRQDIRIPVRAAPFVAGSKLYVVTADSKLFALDRITGDVIWEDQGYTEGASFLASASPVYSNGLLAIPYASAELKVVTADEGRVLWSDVLAMTKRSAAASNFSGIGGAPVIIDNAIYAVSTAGVLSAYQLGNGRRIWEQAISSVNRPWVSGNVVYIYSSNGQVIALNRFDGRIYWAAELPKYENEAKRISPYHWTGPVLAGDVLYIVGAHGVMKRINALTGEILSDIEIEDDLLSAPVVVDGRIYLVSKDAGLHVIY